MKKFVLTSCFVIFFLLVVTVYIYKLDQKFDYTYKSDHRYTSVDFNTPTDINSDYVFPFFSRLSYKLGYYTDALSGLLGVTFDIGKDLLLIDDSPIFDTEVVFDSYYKWKSDVSSFSSDFKTHCSTILVDQVHLDVVFMVDLCRFEFLKRDSQYTYYHCYFCDDPRRLLVDSSLSTDLFYFDQRCDIPLDELHDMLSDLGVSHKYDGVYYDYTVKIPITSSSGSSR